MKTFIRHKMDIMVDVIKATFDVAFDEPFDIRKVYFDLAECCMATSIWSESMGDILESIFIDAFKEHFDNLPDIL